MYNVLITLQTEHIMRKFYTFWWVFLVSSLQKLKKTTGFSSFTISERFLPKSCLENVDSKDWLHCLIACQRRGYCIAYNYNLAQKNCELLKEGIVRQDDYALQLLENRMFVYHQMKPGCSSELCMNNGRCVQDLHGRSEPYCKCNNGYEGHRCQVKQHARFHFTNLNSNGAYGPQSNLGYKGTSLANVKVTEGIQEWSIPRSGVYHVEVAGASGGDGRNAGGRGAVINGTVHIKKGLVLQILIGQMGQSANNETGSGGGGTFVVFKKNSSALVVAGGGGGGGALHCGDPGQNSSNGSVNGGNNMTGGRVCLNGTLTTAGGGGGLQWNGTCASSSPCAQKACENGGRSFLEGGRGGLKGLDGNDGGFGGGGSSDKTAAGGGGGFSGGGVQFSLFPSGAHAGGGGSFAAFKNFSVSTRSSRGHGHVLFHYLA